jgi:transposase InsO family protein
VTDAYSHKVVGWVLSDTLRASASIEALRQAIKQAVAMTGSNMLKGLTHHSDRGVQYCCDAYVAILKSYGISISMTEDYKPTDNAIAERVNGIIKEECVYRQRQFNSSEHASEVIGRFIHFYNYRRPHMSIAYKIPAVAHMEQGEQPKMWKNKFFTKKGDTNENNVISLPGQTTGPGESVCQQP